MGIAIPLLIMVAAGSWWAVGTSAGTGPTTTGSAEVVSSPACRNGDEGTVVDIRNSAGQPAGTVRRATMDSCGHRVGEVLAVDYSVDDPTRVLPAAVDPDDASDGLLPLAVVLAALLGLAATVAAVRDHRRTRHASSAAGAAHSRHDAHGRHAAPEEIDPSDAEVEPPPLPVRPSDLDLLFPDHHRLAANLRDELFTHRSPAGV